MSDITYAYEASMARMERSNKRLWIICIILIGALILSNLAWIIYESQFETVIETQKIEAEQNGDGVNIVGGGDINYGAEGTYNNDDEETR